MDISTLLKAGSEKNFSLPFRVRLQNNKLETNLALDGENLAWVESVAAIYAHLQSTERASIRQFFDTDDKLWHLIAFSELTCRKAKPSAADLNNAVAALCIENGRFDIRDTALQLRQIMRAAEKSSICTELIRCTFDQLSVAPLRGRL
ncbi:MAG TPA: hypothetical protein VEH27_10220 [Methylomirabilota bacterium]|nr:hypothetical protein [Methylomirabilota bacterium]